jgi:hypothetical protein
MPQIHGIEFNEKSYGVVEELIATVKLWGDCESYPLPRMQHGRGEIRIAHQGPNSNRRKAKGVFARIYPTRSGATYIPRRACLNGAAEQPVVRETLPQILDLIRQVFEWSKPQSKTGSVRVDPNPPGTVQGGRFESNRRKF